MPTVFEQLRLKKEQEQAAQYVDYIRALDSGNLEEAVKLNGLDVDAAERDFKNIQRYRQLQKLVADNALHRAGVEVQSATRIHRAAVVERDSIVAQHEEKVEKAKAVLNTARKKVEKIRKAKQELGGFDQCLVEALKA